MKSDENSKKDAREILDTCNAKLETGLSDIDLGLRYGDSVKERLHEQGLLLSSSLESLRENEDISIELLKNFATVAFTGLLGLLAAPDIFSGSREIVFPLALLIVVLLVMVYRRLRKRQYLVRELVSLNKFQSEVLSELREARHAYLDCLRDFSKIGSSLKESKAEIEKV